MSMTFKRPTARRTPPEKDANGMRVQRFPDGYRSVRHPNGAVTMVRQTPKPRGKAAVKQLKRARKNG
jgi:hypothetical protein